MLPVSDDEIRAALAREGSQSGAARALGMARTTLQGRIDRMARMESAAARDQAIENAMQAAQSGMVPREFWVKTDKQDGTAYSVRFVLKPEQEDVLARIADAVAGVPAVPKIAPPKHSDADLMTVYPLADVHMGMLAWGRETGEDYDLRIARERVVSWVGRCVASSPASSLAIILDVGDLMHADDQTNQTPRSKHVLDVDTRYYRTLETTIATLSAAIELAAKKHARVLVRILPGNHNPHSYMAVMFALAERYRGNPRVEVQKMPGEFFAFEFGSVLLAAHHGDKAKAQQMVLFLADEFYEMWGRTKHRFLWTGHLHHHKSQDIGGVQWEQLRALTARDAYAVSHAYAARAQMQAVTYHRERGEIQRVKVGP